MFTYALAWIIALASLGLYLTASAFPEIHRKNDVILGGIGVFYALVLVANAKTMPFGLLLGQAASVTLIIWLGRQSLQQRSMLASPDTPRPEPGSLEDRLRNLMISIGQLWEPLIAILVDGLRSSLSGESDSETDGAPSEATDGAAPTNLWTQLGQSITNLVSGEAEQEVKNTVTVTASHDVADEGDAMAADRSQTIADSSPEINETTEQAEPEITSVDSLDPDSNSLGVG